MEKVVAFYKKLMSNQEIPAEKIRDVAFGWLYLNIDADLDYLRAEPWNRLVLGLHANGVQICGRCLGVRPLADFVGEYGELCPDCRVASKENSRRRWRKNQRVIAQVFKQYGHLIESPPKSDRNECRSSVERG